MKITTKEDKPFMQAAQRQGEINFSNQFQVEKLF